MSDTARTELGGEDAGRQRAAGPALIGAGAQGGVALDVLGGAHAGPGRAAQVGHRRVAGEVDEVRRPGVLVARMRDDPQEPRRHRRRLVDLGRRGGARREAPCDGGTNAGPPSVVQTGPQRLEAAGGAGHLHAVHRLRGHKRAGRRVEAHARLVGAEQRERRGEAARDEQQVARDVAGGRAHHARRVQLRQADGLERRLAPRGGDGLGGPHLDPGVRAAPGPDRGRLRPRVHDGRDVDPGLREVERGRVGAVVRGEGHGAPPGEHPEAVRVRARGAGEHHAGPVVAGEGDRPLVRTRRQDDAASADAPQPLPGDVLRRVAAQVVGAALHRDHEVARVAALDGRSQQQPDLRHRAELVPRRPAPGRRRAAVAVAAHAQQASAREVPLVGHDHPRAAAPGREGGGQAGGPGAHHEHVAVGVHRVVHRIVGLVAQTTASREPARLEPVAQLDRRGGSHRLLHRAVEGDPRARLLHARGEDPARAPEADAPADDLDPVGQQRRRERVAEQAHGGPPVERERQGSVAIHVPAGREAQGPAHVAPGSAGASTWRISSVAVSRTT